MAVEGRPSDYTLELSDLVCAKVAEGVSMRSIAKIDGMPVTTTLFRWLREKPEFKQQYEIAKEECAEMYAEDIIEIADDSSNDYSEGEDKKLNAENVQRSRLRVDARKWVASKLKPKKFGDKVQQELTLKTKIEDLTDEELDAYIASKS